MEIKSTGLAPDAPYSRLTASLLIRCSRNRKDADAPGYYQSAEILNSEQRQAGGSCHYSVNRHIRHNSEGRRGGLLLPLALEVCRHGGHGGGVEFGVRRHGRLGVYPIGLNEILAKG